MARKKPYTTEELFNAICGILKGKGKMPDGLEYAIAERWHPEEIRTGAFTFTNSLEYGGSEGIYLGMGIVADSDEDDGNGLRECPHLGTFKTLDTSPEAMHTMAALLADFIIEGTAFVNANLDDFTWTGADVAVLKDDGSGGTKRVPRYSCGSMEGALRQKDRLLADESVLAVIIRDNATRKETLYRKDGTAERIKPE